MKETLGKVVFLALVIVPGLQYRGFGILLIILLISYCALLTIVSLFPEKEIPENAAYEYYQDPEFYLDPSSMLESDFKRKIITRARKEARKQGKTKPEANTSSSNEKPKKVLRWKPRHSCSKFIGSKILEKNKPQLTSPNKPAYLCCDVRGIKAKPKIRVGDALVNKSFIKELLREESDLYPTGDIETSNAETIDEKMGSFMAKCPFLKETVVLEEEPEPSCLFIDEVQPRAGVFKFKATETQDITSAMISDPLVTYSSSYLPGRMTERDEHKNVIGYCNPVAEEKNPPVIESRERPERPQLYFGEPLLDDTTYNYLVHEVDVPEMESVKSVEEKVSSDVAAEAQKRQEKGKFTIKEHSVESERDIRGLEKESEIKVSSKGEPVKKSSKEKAKPSRSSKKGKKTPKPEKPERRPNDPWSSPSESDDDFDVRNYRKMLDDMGQYCEPLKEGSRVKVNVVHSPLAAKLAGLTPPTPSEPTNIETSVMSDVDIEESIRRGQRVYQYLLQKEMQQVGSSPEMEEMIRDHLASSMSYDPQTKNILRKRKTKN